MAFLFLPLVPVSSSLSYSPMCPTMHGVIHLQVFCSHCFQNARMRFSTSVLRVHDAQHSLPTSVVQLGRFCCRVFLLVKYLVIPPDTGRNTYLCRSYPCPGSIAMIAFLHPSQFCASFGNTFIVVTCFATFVSSLLITWPYHERRFWATYVVIGLTIGSLLNFSFLIRFFLVKLV